MNVRRTTIAEPEPLAAGRPAAVDRTAGTVGRGRGSVFRHARLDRWAGKWVDPTGKAIWVYAASERECWAKLDRKRTDRLLEIERGPAVPSQNPLEAPEVVPWLLAWAKGQNGHPRRWRPSTRKRAIELLDSLVRSRAWEGKHFSDIRIRDVQAIIDQAGSESWPSRWSWRTVRHFHSCLRVAFGDAVREGIVLTANPTVGVILPELQDPPPIALEDEERKSLIEEGLRRRDGQVVHRLGDLITFLSLTGLRSGEARALTYDDVDLRKKEARITKTVSIGVEKRLSIGPPKRESSQRCVALPTQAVDIIGARAREAGVAETDLGKYRTSATDTREVKGKLYRRLALGGKEVWVQAPSSSELIWMTSKGTPYDHQAVRKALHEVIRSARHHGLDRFRCANDRVVKRIIPLDWKGAPHCPVCHTDHWPPFHPHVLRSAAISFWLRNDGTAVAAAERAGHSDPRMVLKFYARSTKAEDRQLASLDD